MSDEFNKRVDHGCKRINVKQPHELRTWWEEFGLPPGRLKRVEAHPSGNGTRKGPQRSSDRG